MINRYEFSIAPNKRAIRGAARLAQKAAHQSGCDKIKRKLNSREPAAVQNRGYFNAGATRVKRQPTLFDKQHAAASADIDDQQLVLYALGDFQARGKVLAERDLPLDRLRGAFKRAAEKFELAELDDNRLVAALSALGARIKQVPVFVAKHPYRVIVSTALAGQALDFLRERNLKEDDRQAVARSTNKGGNANSDSSVSA